MDWREIKEFFSDAFKYILSFFIIIFIAIYIVGLQQVVGSSMAPNLKNNEVILVNKAIYTFREPKRFEIVAINTKKAKLLVKRVIGLPGDYIEYIDNQLYINNKVVAEPYLKDIITDDFSLEDIGDGYDKIPENYYLVLGDNRQNSDDSRTLGLIKKSEIIGKSAIRIWPITKFKLIK